MLMTINSVQSAVSLGFLRGEACLINLESFVLVSRPSLKTDCMWPDFMFSFRTAVTFNNLLNVFSFST